jgi:PAS domain S-box-containing protein
MKADHREDKILYIDDEQANLDGFKFNFRKDYQVLLAASTREAFEIISKNTIKVVISDNRMPDMLGIEFFEILSISHPDIIRIIVSAYADTDVVMQAINKGKVYKFITKPWNKNELQVTINNAFESYNLRQQNQELLSEMTFKNKELEDLNFRLMIEVAERSKAEEELDMHRLNLEQLVKQRTGELDKINIDLALANNELVAVNEELNSINEEIDGANKKLNHEIKIRTQVQDLLAESENKYRGLIEQSSEGIMLIAIDGKIIECNQAIGKMLDINYRNITGSYIWDFDYMFTPKHLKDSTSVEQIKTTILNFINDFEKNKSYSIEGYRETPSGNEKYLSTIIFPVITPKGKFLGMVMRDFTEKKISENALKHYQEDLEVLVKERTAQLQESEQRLRTISDNLPGGAIYHGFTNKNGVDQLVYASASIVEISGFAYEQLIENIGQFFAKVHPLDIEKLIESRKRGQRRLELLDLEMRYVRHDNDILWIHLRTMFKKGNDGNIWWDGYVIDITSRKLAEKAAQERDSIINNIHEGIASTTGEKLFETIVLKLTETLNADYTFIGEISGDLKDSIRTISIGQRNKIIENIEYLLDGAPCESAIDKKVFSIPHNLYQHYPNHLFFSKFNVDGYVGVALFDSHDKPIGVMASMFSQPITDTRFAEQMLQIFSSRVGVEIERIKAESDLKEREERFRTLFDMSPNLMLINQFDGTILECNSAFSEILGYSKDEVVGNTTVKLGIWSNQDRAKVFGKLKKNKNVRNIEISYIDKKGQKHYALTSVEPIVINSETNYLTTATDITERKKAEEAIQQYSDIANNMQVALNVYYLEDIHDIYSLVLVKANPAADKMIGIKCQEMLGKKFSEVLPMLKGYGLEQIFSNVVITGQPYENEEFRYYRENGEILFYAVKAFVMPNNHVGLLFEDITHRKRIEKAVKDNEERYRALFDKSPNGIHLVGTNGKYSGKIVSANPIVSQMLGYSEKDLIGLPMDAVTCEILIEDKIKWTERLMAGESINYETNFYRKDNSSFPVEVTSSVISLGDEVLILSIDRDISERKLSEQLMRESEQKLLNIFNSSNDGILIFDPHLNIIDVNQTLFSMLGYETNDMEKAKTLNFIPIEYHQQISERVEKINAGEKVSDITIELFKKDGSALPVEVNSKLINHDGKHAILTIIRDITERKNMEKKLFETIISTEEREREHFAGDLHDEVGPLLSSLKMYLSLLAETDDKKKKEYIFPQIQTLIKESITTVREISNDLSPHVLNNYGCVAAINSFLGLKRDFMNITFNQNLESKRFNQSIETVIYRIVKELINNTIKHAKANDIDIKLYDDENTIRLQYSDNGIGFNIDTTGENTKGSIGLLNIMSRVKTVNGKYKISSSEGTGFRFELTVPIY